MNDVPEYLRPTQVQIESACRAYYDADERAQRLAREAAVARSLADRLRVAALDLCNREREWSA